jgi:hypothetical protein
MSKVLERPAVLAPQEHRLLADGRHVLGSLSNAAYPSDGWWLNQLEARGLMSCEVDRRGGPQDWRFTYSVTPAGRDAFVSYKPPLVPLT